eukprot:CAMPEP_0185383466 /NCGR_PEP_ID=MMETSP1364-20130426/57629_1 /TAXON_ID=38817 /ORGANISM="Gephyrocapsa oceanica, Strain RCC1303" /LENGTH=53 /DNA_ID=CAMNT_0027985197 /DNA_START=53 /DNA_END=211 /DNA_ORIENTATION=-
MSPVLSLNVDSTITAIPDSPVSNDSKVSSLVDAADAARRSMNITAQARPVGCN